MYKIPAKTLFIGKSLHFLPSCHSTNTEAANLLDKNPAIEGSIVITDNQLAGKGQRGNSWISAPGRNLTYSIILKPTFLAIVHQFYLNIIISLGIIDFLKKFDKQFQVKWPNDVYFKNKKICGILIRNSVKGSQLESSIVGIGLNINEDFENSGPVSLSMVTGKQHDLNEIFEQLNEHLEKRYLQLRSGDMSSLKQEYLSNMYWFGEDHLFQNDEVFQGRIIGISDAGLLEVQTNTGLKHFNIKEVKFLT